jgi:hypothetical protein
MQWSALTEEKQKNELAQSEFRFIKTIKIILIRGGQLQFVLRMNAGGIYGHMVSNKRKETTLRCSKYVVFASNAGGGSLTSCVSDARR